MEEAVLSCIAPTHPVLRNTGEHYMHGILGDI